MKKRILILISMLAMIGLTVNAQAQVKTYAYPSVEWDFETEGEEIPSDLPEDDGPSTQDDVAEKSWDGTRETKIKKSRGFKKVGDRFEELGEIGAESLDRLFGKLDQISLDISLKGKLKVADGAHIRVKYEYDAGPAYYGNKFSRMDGYELSFPIKFLELLGLDSVFGISTTPGVRVRFWQFFDNLKAARKLTNGYNPKKHLPLTAKEARDNLKPGDLVMIDGLLNYSYGLSKVWDDIVDWLTFSLGGHRSVNSRFRAFVFRTKNKYSDDMVRVRVSAIHDTPKIVNAKISIFDLFDLGWGRLTELVEKALKLNKFVDAKMEWVDRQIWLADYTLDLSEPLVRNAYNAVFDRNNRVRGLAKTAHPFKSTKDIRNSLFELVRPLTEVSLDEQNKDKNDRKAEINFMGSNYSDGEQLEFQGGMRGALRVEKLRSKKDNRLTQVIHDADGNPHNYYYFYPSWIKRTKSSGCFTLCREYIHQAANIIYSADRDPVTGEFKIIDFENIGFYREQTDKEYSYKEHVKMLEGFQKILPPSMFQDFVDKLAKNNWGKFSKKRQNVRVTARYFISKEGLERVKDVTSPQIQRLLIAGLHELDMESKRFGYAGEISTGSLIRREICPLDELRSLGARTWKQMGSKNKWKTDPKGEDLGAATLRYCKKIKKFSDKLANALRPGLRAQKRHELFSSFTRSKLFRKLGPGILFDILGAGGQSIDDLTYFEIVFNASGQKEPVRYTSGEVENRPLHDIIEQMERILNDDQPDMRQPGDEESHVTRMVQATN